MARLAKGSARLRGRYVLIAGLPAAILLVAMTLLSLAGHPVGSHPELDAFSGTSEAGARTKLLATFFLASVFAVAMTAYFFWRLPLFDRLSRRALLGAYVFLAGLGLFCLALGQPEEAHRFLGEQAVCRAMTALEAGQEPARKAVPPPPTAPPPTTPLVRETTTMFSPSIDCPGARYWTMMRVLNGIERILLALVSPALILGMIAALATGPGITRRDQAERLNSQLHLSAAMLVAGLLFISALLRWPGYALAPAPRALFDAHASAITLYWGVVYSLFIASAYLPLAAILRRRQADEPTDDPNPDPLLGTRDMLKNAASIFAPAIAGLLTGVVSL